MTALMNYVIQKFDQKDKKVPPIFLTIAGKTITIKSEKNYNLVQYISLPMVTSKT